MSASNKRPHDQGEESEAAIEASDPKKLKSLDVPEEAHDDEEAVQGDEGDNDDASDTQSSSDASDSSSNSDSEEDTEESESESVLENVNNEANDGDEAEEFNICPLRSLINSPNNSGSNSRSFSPIVPENDFSHGPVDPVFVEESSGEAVASAADHDDMQDFLPLPGQPPLPPPPSAAAPQPQAPHPESEEPIKGTEPEQPQSQNNSINVSKGAESDSMDEEELDALLEADAAKKLEAGEEIPHSERTKYRLVEKGKNHFDYLPYGWMKIDHFSGMPLYLHRYSRVLTASKPYYVGRASIRAHYIPVDAIPCLNYKKALEEEAVAKQNVKDANKAEEVETSDTAGGDNAEAKAAMKSFPKAKIETAAERARRVLMTPDQYREYCEKLFVFEQRTVKRFPSWKDRRTFYRQEQKKEIQKVKESVQAAEEAEKAENQPPTKNVNAQPTKPSPPPSTSVASLSTTSPSKSNNTNSNANKSKNSNTKGNFNNSPKKDKRPILPEGTKIISIPVVEFEPEDPNAKENPLHQKIVKKTKKDWILNPAGKSTVCILHEYLQHSIKKAPTYVFKETDSAATPYSATTIVNGIEYGRGLGSSKKEAKNEAARLTLEILIPEFKEVNSKNGIVKKEPADLSFFDNVRIEDPNLVDFCNKTSEPMPYTILLTCLQKNYGLGDTSIAISLTPFKNKKNKFTMKINQKEVSVICRNKREGKQRASQKMLQLLHPHIKTWGSLLRMYGSHAISAQKSKKERQSEVTSLQTQNSGGMSSPNTAILAKLRTEMKALAERKKAATAVNLGKLTLNRDLLASNSDQSEKTINRIAL